jgi:predicted nucleotidyltransferase
VKERTEILELLRMLKPSLQVEYPLYALALFGSYARDEQRPNSDVDILVEVDPSIGLRFVELAERLEHSLGEHVDLVSRRALKPAMLRQIEAELINV